MKKYIILFLPIFIYASSFSELIKSVDKNLLVKSKQEQTKALNSMLEAKKSKNSPFVDIEINAVRLKDTPTTSLSALGLTSPIAMGTKTNLDASLSITYPLFTGFAITNSIEKARLEVVKNELETADLKRKIYLKIAGLYAQVFSLDRALEATKEAKIAIDDSYKKAKGLYDNGFINIANLYKIEAQKYDIEATMASYKEQKQNALNNLFYITQTKADASQLPQFDFALTQDTLIQKALKNREDIKALQTSLKIDDYDIKLVKSKLFPQIGLFAALKKQGDDLSFNGNGFTNADESYVGASLKWNVFDANERKKKQEAAQYKKNTQNIYFIDYVEKVKTQIKNSFLTLASLNYKKKATLKEVSASKSYFELTKGRFENNLASADELSRAIADLASVKGKLQSIYAQIFLQKCQLTLLGGTQLFLQQVRN